MERINRYRVTQPESLEDFILRTLDKPNCSLCDYLTECQEYMGFDIQETLGDYGCSAFDTSTEALTKHYLLKYCTKKA